MTESKICEGVRIVFYVRLHITHFCELAEADACNPVRY